MGLWTVEHVITLVPTFLLMLLISLFMRKLLINKTFEIRMLPIKIIAVVIVVIEIGKQICSALRGYDLYHIPLHFCSIFVFILPIIAFYRAKGQEHLRSVGCAAMLSLFFGMLLMPNVIYSSNRLYTFFTDYLSFHTVFVHNLVIFAFFLVLALDLHKSEATKSEILFISAFGGGFVALSATMSHVLKTNFSNFLYSTVGFVADLVEQLKASVGETLVTVIYTVVLCILHVLLLIITNYLFKQLCTAKDKVLKYIFKE